MIDNFKLSLKLFTGYLIYIYWFEKKKLYELVSETNEIST